MTATLHPPDGPAAAPRVLIVDTDAAPTTYLDERFGTGAFEVQVAADPELALELAQQGPPTLVLISAELLGAVEAVARFKEDDLLGEVPVVLMARGPVAGRLVHHWFGRQRADLTVRLPLRGSFLARFVSLCLGPGAVRQPLDEDTIDTDDDEASAVGTWRERAIAAEQTVEDALSRARNAENELGMMRLEVEGLSKKLAAAEEGVLSDTGTLLDDTGELEVRALTLQRRLQDADRELARRESRAEAAEADLHRQLAEVQALRREIRVTETENDRLRSKETTLLADLEAMAITESRLREKIADYRGQLGLVGDMTDEYTAELEEVAIDSAEVDRAAHERAAAAEYSLKLKQAEVDEIKEEIGSRDADIARLQGQLTTLRKDLDLLYDREQDLADERAAEQRRLQTTLHELAELKEELAERGRKIQELQKELADRDRKLKVLGKLG